jgi:DNA replication protein DnaC
MKWISDPNFKRRGIRHYDASPTGGKSHLAAAIGLALVENAWRVLLTRASDLVQRLQIARRELESAIAKLDKYHLLSLDDIAFRTQGPSRAIVLFELIGKSLRESYRRRAASTQMR